MANVVKTKSVSTFSQGKFHAQKRWTDFFQSGLAVRHVYDCFQSTRLLLDRYRDFCHLKVGSFKSLAMREIPAIVDVQPLIFLLWPFLLDYSILMTFLMDTLVFSYGSLIPSQYFLWDLLFSRNIYTVIKDLGEGGWKKLCSCLVA